MTFVVLFISLLVGATLAEIAFRALGGLWFRVRLRHIGALLHAFRDAEGDDARQALLLKSGRATLQFSLAILVLIVGLAVIAALAPWVLVWTATQQMAYFLASSLVATGWWIFRASRSSPPNKLPHL